MDQERKFGKRKVKLSNLEKVFFPEAGLTKGDLLDYYEKNSEVILPYLKDRPLTMIRFPNGINDKQFYQKDAPDYFPDWIPTKTIKRKEGGETHYVICNDLATLMYLTNQACITPHIWLSRKDQPDLPDRLIFDLDPSEDDFQKLKLAARKIRKYLKQEFELKSFIMTTGSRGFHISIPIKRQYDFDEVRSFAQAASKELEAEFPEMFTTASRKAKRDGKIYLDVARNGFGQTAVTPYSVRPIEGAPVATPLDWDELSKKDLSAQRYTIKNIFRRLGSKDDPWKNMDAEVQDLSAAIKKLQKD
ncbi:MAG: non-homologous end-joining DNA ligase [Christiangramia sp.]|nr:ATP-dependent DNA ligase [Christiangramia sp.]